MGMRAAFGISKKRAAAFQRELFVRSMLAIKAYKSLFPAHFEILWKALQSADAPPLAELAFSSETTFPKILMRLAAEKIVDPLRHPASRLIYGRLK